MIKLNSNIFKEEPSDDSAIILVLLVCVVCVALVLSGLYLRTRQEKIISQVSIEKYYITLSSLYTVK